MGTEAIESMKVGSSVLKEGTKFAYQLMKLLASYAEGSPENKIAKEMLKHYERGGEFAYVKMKDFLYKDVMQELKSKGISITSYNIKGKNEKMIVVKESDVNALSDARTKVLIGRGKVAEVGIDEMKKLHNGQELNCLKSISGAELEIIRNKSRFNHFTIAVERNIDKYNVYYTPDKEDLIRKALVTCSLNFTGIAGQTFRNQMEYDVETRQNIYDLLRTGEPFTVVSASDPSNSIEFTADAYFFKKMNNILEECARKDDAFYENALRKLEFINNPVVLNKNEMDLDKKKRLLLIKERDGRPRFSKEEWAAQEKERQFKSIIEYKLSQEIADQRENICSYLNNEISISEFLEHDLVNEGHNADEIELVDSHLKLSLAHLERYETETIIATNDTLDSILALQKSDFDIEIDEDINYDYDER